MAKTQKNKKNNLSTANSATTTETPSESAATIDAVLGIDAVLDIDAVLNIENTIQLAPIVKEELTIADIMKKLDVIIGLLSIKNENKLSEMSLTELNFLKEMLNRNINVNKYPGGNIDLILVSNELIIKIDNEVNNRINSYV